MSLTNRKAPEDTAINRDALTEGLDVRGTGRYYPEEFSSQLQIIQHQGSVLSEIPKSLAGIVINYDDYKISSWHDEEQTNINRERIEADNDIRFKENALQLEAGVEIYDTQKQMQSELTTAMEQADINGTKREDAALEVLSKYENPDQFIDRPALQQMWNNTYHNNALNTLNRAQNEDIRTIHAQRAAALNDLISTGYGEVIAGNENPEQSLNRMMPQILDLTKDLPAVEVQKYMNASWNQLVLAKAQLIYEQVNKGNTKPEYGMDALRELAKEYTQKDFLCVDKNGNILKNEDGSDKKFTLTLTPETQNELYRVFKQASSGAGGNDGESILIDYIDSFKRDVGWDEFEKTGTSSKLLKMNPSSLLSFTLQQLKNIDTSNASTSSKHKKANEVFEMHAQLDTFLRIAQQVKKGNTNIQKDINKAITQLENDLKDFNKDWEHYSLNIGGLTLGIAGFNDINPRLLDKKQASKLYWDSALNQFKNLSNLISNGSVGDIFSKIDLKCSETATTLVNATEKGTLTMGDSWSTSTNASGIKTLTDAIRQWDTSIQAYKIPYASIPTETIKGMLDNFDDPQKFPTAIHRFKGMQSVISAFKNTGHITDLVNYTMHNKNEKSEMVSDFMLALCASNVDSKLREKIASTLVTMTADTKKEYENYLKEKGYDKETTHEAAIYQKLDIPKNHRNNLYGDVAKMCWYITSKEHGNVDTFSSYFENLIKSNYVKLDRHTKLQSAVFKYSPQVRPFLQKNGEVDTITLEQCLNATNKHLRRIMQVNTLDDNNWKSKVLKDKYNNLSWYSDDDNGVFRLVDKGKNLGTFNGEYVGSLYYSDAFKKVSPDNIGMINAVRTSTSLIATNSDIRKEFGTHLSVSIDKKDLSKYGLKGHRGRITNLLDKVPYAVHDNYYSNTIAGVYSNTDKDMQKDAIIIANSLHDVNRLNNIAQKMQNAYTKKGAIQDVRSTVPKQLWLRALLNIQPQNLPSTSLVQQKAKYKAGAFMSKGVNTGKAADITQEDYLNAVLSEAESATHVRQADVSVPIALAAIGNEEYIDMYNASQENEDEITGIELPGIFTDNEAADKGYLGNLPDLQYATHLSNKEKQEFNTWISQQRELGNILPEDNFEDYDMQGFWKNEVLNNTEYAAATAETHFPDKYKKPNHPTFSNESIYYNEETANQAGHWEGDTFVPPDGQATGYAANINNMYSGTIKECPDTTTRKYTKNEIANLVDYYAKIFEIPLSLAHAVVRQESGGQQYVTSNAGAVGIMQLMPKTAQGLGVKDSTDAAQNIWGGMKYLAEQYKQFGNWAYSLAAYNAGPGAVNKAKGIPNISQTKNYVKNIMQMAGLSEDLSTFPVRYNFAHPKNQKYIDKDTGLLSPTQLNNFLHVMNNAAGFKNNVMQIKVNRPELLENKKEYADFKKYREMKNSKGQPLFVKGNYNGFQVMLKANNSSNGNMNPASLPAIAEDAYNNQTSTLNKQSAESIEALINTFSSKYNSNSPLRFSFETMGAANFGMANLTSQEYQDYGVPLFAQQNPIMQARVLATEFQRANDILGSERKAIYALAGGKMVDENGSIKSWAEIKKDADNFMKQWFIKPSSDDKERNQINAIVAMYNSEYNRLRGFN